MKTTPLYTTGQELNLILFSHQHVGFPSGMYPFVFTNRVFISTVRQRSYIDFCILILFETTTCFGSSLQLSSGRTLVQKRNKRGRGRLFVTESSPPFNLFVN